MVHHLQATRDVAQTDGLVALGHDGSLRRAVVDHAAEAAADDQTAALRHVLLNNAAGGEIVVTQYMNGGAGHGAIRHGTRIAARDAAGAVHAGDFIAASQGDLPRF